MKIGISTACFNFRQETEIAIATIQDLGAEYADINLRTFYEYRPEFAKELAPLLKGLNISSVSTERCNFERQLFSPSRRIRGDGFYWLDKLMSTANIIGCKNYAFRGCDAVRDNADYDSLANYIRGVAEFCSRFGVKLCLENSTTSLYNKPYIFGELKKRLPELSGVLNLNGALSSGYPYQMFISDMEGAIDSVKLCDRDSCGNTCLPGLGVYDFEEIFKRLKDAGFDGTAIIETDNFTDNKQLKDSLEFLNGIIIK